MTVRYIQTKNIDTGAVRNDQIKMIDDDGVTWIVPEDDLNTDWLQYQAWLGDGNTPEAPN